MSIISRYVLFQFLRLVVLCQSGAIILFLIAEFIERIDDLIEKKAALTDGILYFAFKMPQLVFLSLPVTVLLTSILSLILLSRGNEVVAMRACGASVYQVVSPILAASLAISALAFLGNEYLIPFANRQVQYIWRVKVKKVPLRSYNRLDKLWYRSEDNTFWSITFLDPYQDTMAKVTLYRFDQTNRLVQRIDAARAEWVPEENRWRFIQGLIHHFERNGEIRQEPFQKAHFTLRDKPEDFKKEGKKPEEMRWGELRRYIRAMQKSGVDTTRYLVDLWAKLSTPFVSFVLALVGVPFSLKSSRSAGLALGVATAVGIGAVYLILFYVGLSLGHAGRLPPLVAAWGPNAIFLAGGCYFMTHLRG